MTAQITGRSPADLATSRLASSVNVLTVNHDGVWHGITAAAVVLISRHPPMLGVCLRPGSTFASLAHAAGYFSVNILTDEQAALATRFASRSRPMGEAQFAGLPLATDPETDAPLIDGCLAHLSCRVDEEHAIGDHLMTVASVVAGDAEPNGDPLLSFANRLHNDRSARP